MHILHCCNLLLQSVYKNGRSGHRPALGLLANGATIQGVVTPAHVSNGPVCGVAWPAAILSFVWKERAAGREGPKVVRQPASAGFCDVWRRPAPAREMSGSGRTCTDKSTGLVHLPPGVNGPRPASSPLYSHHIPAWKRPIAYSLFCYVIVGIYSELLHLFLEILAFTAWVRHMNNHSLCCVSEDGHAATF